MKRNNLIEVFKSKNSFQNVGITFINKTKDEDFLSYKELYHSSVKILASLQQKGLETGEELVLQIDDNKIFILVFWACILGGIIPVPLTVGDRDDRKIKFYNVCSVLKKPWVIAGEKIFRDLEEYAKKNKFKKIHHKITKKFIDVMEVLNSKTIGKIFSAKPNDVAFIQFSSGSTGNPKGIILTHENLVTNVKAIAKAAEYAPTDSMLSWMPLTHDMGLIGFHINPLFSGMNHYLIPTDLFVRRPALWFDKASEYNITILCSPNFGYKYIMKHCLKSEYSWNLSNIRLIYNGAEPISEKLCHDFLAWAKAYGLKPTSMCPVYGLAEASLAVSISGLDDHIISCQIKRDKLNFGDKIEFSSDTENAVSFVNVGKSIDNCTVAVADNEMTILNEEVIGNIVIKGQSVTSGYYPSKEKTDEVIKGKWLKTGDLGFLKEGCLYITGRDKDIIFMNGQNYYPHDLESIAQEVEGIELNKIVIVGSFNPTTQNEETVAFIFHRGSLEKFVEIALKVSAHLNSRIGFMIDRVLPVTNIPKTTSGKLQRFKPIEDYENGLYEKTQTQLNELTQKFLESNIQIVGPENENEEKILFIWRRILNNERIGVTCKFFEIGGNSLRAAEIIMNMQKEFEVEIPLAVFYKLNTVRDLSEILEDLSKKKYLPIPKIKKDKYHILSFAQKRLFYAWELNKDSTAYNIPIAFDIIGAIDKQKAQKVLYKLASRHSILRAKFYSFDEPKYKIREHIVIPFEVISCKKSHVNKTLKDLIKPFDLFSDILLRCTILRSDNNSILFFDFHHIIIDGLSVQKFIEEFNLIYNEQIPNPLVIDYKDYSHWQRERFKSDNINIQEKFWVKTFENGIPTLELPVDRPRPSILNEKGKRVRFQIDDTTTTHLKELATVNTTSLYVLVFSIYKWLLAKITGQYEVVIGIPVSGRSHVSIQHVLGMFVNNLPILAKIDKKENFIGSLKRDISLFHETLAHQEYPYTAMVDKLMTFRDVSRNPLFDTMFLFSPTVIENKTCDYNLNQHFFDSGSSKFDLSLEIFEEDRNLCYILEYSTSLFNSQIEKYFPRYFEKLIEMVVKNQKITFSEISFLDPEALKDRIETFNDNQIVFSQKETIVGLFEKQVKKTPEAIAIETSSEKITFKVLNDKVEAFKNYLHTLGVSKADVVAVSLKRSPKLIYTLLGILKVGAIYLPIDTETPVERLKFIVDDSKSKYLICDSEKEGLDLQKCKCIILDFNIIKYRNETFAYNSIQDDDLAYMIYTSGTTGKPKGVIVNHRAIGNYIKWASKEYIGNESLNFPLFTAIDFDLTFTSLFLPLVSGNKMIIYEDDNNEMSLERVFTSNNSGIVKLTPSHLKILINNNIWVAPSIKKIIVGGEKLTPETVHDFLKHSKHEVEIYNEYGPTEATIGCMIHKFSPSCDNTTIPIGKPIANSKIYVLDEFKNPVPEGIIGEIHISGDCLSRGYVNNEELTNEKFIANPFVDGALMYRSGDLAKVMSSGIIQYIGRIDEQVKINGYRIEKEEIRQALIRYKGIKDVVLTTSPNLMELLELNAYYIRDSKVTGKTNLVDLKSYLMDCIPHYMIPKNYIEIDTIPLSKNGKVNIQKLIHLKQNMNQLDQDIAYEEYDQQILDIYRAVLEAPDFGMRSNFYEFGGDSIKAVQIVSKLRQERINITPKDVLTYNSVGQLSLFLDHKTVPTSNHLEDYLQEILTGKKESSPIERWFFNRKFKNQSFYNQSILLKLCNKAKKDVLRKTFQELIRHHDGLRLNVELKKQILFFNNRHLQQDFELQNHSIKSENELPELCELLRSTFDLTKSLLIKAALIEFEENDDQMLFITAHHLVIDGFSWRILLEDFYRIYHTIDKKKEVKAIWKTASLPRFIKTLNDHFNEDRIAREVSYWKPIIQEPFELPQDSETTLYFVKDLSHDSIELDKHTTNWLLRDSSSYNVDIQIILNTVLAKTLSDWCNCSKVKIELENHGRHLEDLNVSKTIGWFTVMHPIVYDIQGDLINNLLSVKEAIKNIPEHGMGYGIIKKISKNILDTITEVRFNYLGQFGKEMNNDLFSLQDREIGIETDGGNQLTAKLEINAMIVSRRLKIKFSFSSKTYQEATITYLKESFLKNLEKLIDLLRESKQPLLTPSDFNALEISQNELDSLFK